MSSNVFRLRTAGLCVAVAMLLGACANTSETTNRTLIGAGVGAAGGAVIGSFGADAGWGALIGAGIGAAGGYLYDRNKQREEEAYRRGYSDAKRRASPVKD